MNNAIISPCVGICSTAIGDELCLGCARTFAEISDWLTLDDAARDAIMQALPARRLWLRIAALLDARIETVSNDALWANLLLGSHYRLSIGLPYALGDQRWLPVLRQDGVGFRLLISVDGWLPLLWQSLFDEQLVACQQLDFA